MFSFTERKFFRSHLLPAPFFSCLLPPVAYLCIPKQYKHLQPLRTIVDLGIKKKVLRPIIVIQKKKNENRIQKGISERKNNGQFDAI